MLQARRESSQEGEILYNILTGKIGSGEISETRDILEMEQNSFRHAHPQKHADPDRRPAPKDVLKKLRALAKRVMRVRSEEKEKLVENALGKDGAMAKYKFYLSRGMWPDILILRAPLTVFTYSQAGARPPTRLRTKGRSASSCV